MLNWNVVSRAQAVRIRNVLELKRSWNQFDPEKIQQEAYLLPDLIKKDLYRETGGVASVIGVLRDCSLKGVCDSSRRRVGFLAFNVR